MSHPPAERSFLNLLQEYSIPLIAGVFAALAFAAWGGLLALRDERAPLR